MGFFGLFKSKEEKNIDAGLQGMMKMIFPLGESDVLRDCQRVDILTNGKIPDSDLRSFVSGCKTI